MIIYYLHLYLDQHMNLQMVNIVHVKSNYDNIFQRYVKQDMHTL